MAMLPGDYKRRVQSANKSASVGAGFSNSPVHVPGDSQPHQVSQAGMVVTLLSINATSTAGVLEYFQDSAGTKQVIMSNALTPRDYKQHFYCPWPVYVVSDVDVTVYVAGTSKGNTTD